MGDFDDMIPEYITESTELLADVEGGFLALEEGSADDDVVNTIFRAIHSIKGGAGFVGLSKIERLAHKMEDLLGLIRNHDMEATPDVTDVLIKGLDVLKALFDNVEDMDAVDIEPSLQALVQVLEGTAAIQDAVTVALAQDVAGLPAFDVSNYVLKNAFSQGNVFFLKLDLVNLESRGINPMELVSELLSMGEILDTNFHMPSLDVDYESMDLSVDVLYSTVLEPDLLVAALYLEEGEYRLLSDKDFDLSDPDGQPFAAPPPAPPVAPELKQPPQPAAVAPQTVAPRPVAAVAPQPAPQPAPRQNAPVAPEPKEPLAGKNLPKVWEDKDYLTFRLESEIYAVDILRVQEIIGVPHMARLPRSRQDVLGVMNLRGMVVPVFDLRRRLNLNYDPDSPAVVVVMRQDEKIMGGVVDEVRDVVHINGQDMQEAPLFTPSLADNAPDPRAFCLEGLTYLNNETIIVLDVDKVFGIGGS